MMAMFYSSSLDFTCQLPPGCLLKLFIPLRIDVPHLSVAAYLLFSVSLSKEDYVLHKLMIEMTTKGLQVSLYKTPGSKDITETYQVQRLGLSLAYRDQRYDLSWTICMVRQAGRDILLQ